MKQWENLFQQAKDVLELLPVGVCVCSPTGEIMYQNVLFHNLIFSVEEIAHIVHAAAVRRHLVREFPFGKKTIRLTAQVAGMPDSSVILMLAEDVTAEKALIVTLNAATGCLQLVQKELAAVVEEPCPFTVTGVVDSPLNKYLSNGQPRVLLIGPRPFNHLAIQAIYTAGFALYRAHDVLAALAMVPAFKPTLAIVEQDTAIEQLPDLVRNIRRTVPEAAIVGVGHFNEPVSLMFNECLVFDPDRPGE